MSNEKTEIANNGATMSSETTQAATITLGGVAFVGLAAVGTYVVTKKASAALHQRREIHREMKKLYKEKHKSAK